MSKHKKSGSIWQEEETNLAMSFLSLRAKCFMPELYGLSVRAPVDYCIGWESVELCGSSWSVCQVLSLPNVYLCLDVSVLSKGIYQSYLLCLSRISLDLPLSVLDLSQIGLVRLGKNWILLLIAYSVMFSQFWKCLYLLFLKNQASTHTCIHECLL